MLKNANYIYENNIIADEVNTTKRYCKKAQVGVDVTVRDILYIEGTGQILTDKTIVPNYAPVTKWSYEGRKGWLLRKGTYIINLNEGVQFGPNDTGIFIQRSSLNRSGCTVVSSVWDPGFTTQAGEAINAPTLRLVVNADSVFIEENARVAQLIIFTNENTELYDGQFQGGRLKSKLEESSNAVCA